MRVTQAVAAAKSLGSQYLHSDLEKLLCRLPDSLVDEATYGSILHALGEMDSHTKSPLTQVALFRHAQHSCQQLSHAIGHVVNHIIVLLSWRTCSYMAVAMQKILHIAQKGKSYGCHFSSIFSSVGNENLLAAVGEVFCTFLLSLC